MTPKEQALVDLLGKVLPGIHRNRWPSADGPALQQRICVDLEWDEDGELDLIGVGNRNWMSQFWWKELPTARRLPIIGYLMNMVRNIPVVMQNASGDIRKLQNNGFPIFGPECFFKLDDTMLAHHALHSEEDHDLGYLNATYGSLPDYKHLRTVEGAESIYNAADLVSTCVVMDRLDAELGTDPGAATAYHRALSFLWLQIEGEEAGIRVNPYTPVPLFKKYDEKRQQAARLADAYAGFEINLNSPDDMKHILYNVEGFPIQRAKGAKWGEESKATTDKDAISTLRRLQGTEWEADVPPTLEQAMENIEDGGHPILEARYLHMGAQQAISHYISPCVAEDGVNPRDRIYPECRQHVQASGRHSYVGPALTQFKDEILTLITPDVGTCWVGHDWKQIEVRILAILANDIPYLEAFARGDDVHEINVRAIFPVKGSVELEALRRRWVKAFAFRLHYRGQAENAGDIPGTKALFAGDRRLSDTELKRYLVDASKAYLDLHPAFPIYWARIEDEIKRTEMVRTFAGRPRRLTSLFEKARLREGCNHPMQGGVTDIYVETALLVKEAAPWARLVFGAFDSQNWQVPVKRKLEFTGIYAPIVTRPIVINGQQWSFPADFKFREAA